MLSLDVWPALPLAILGFIFQTSVVNIIHKLKHNDRIRQIHLQCCTNKQIETLWTAMQVPFPELVVLYLRGWEYVPVPALPDSFLGQSAPRLRYLCLLAVPFPGLPKLLLSTHLVYLWLLGIPHSGYISPEAMATCLSVLTSLKTLQLEFESPQSSPDQENRRSFPPTRFVLPCLTHFWFKGVNKYLEDLLSRIDAPQVYRLSTTFFDDIHFHTAELNQFISRTPTFGGFNGARLVFRCHEALVWFQSHPAPSDHGMVEVKILCQVQGRQVSSLAQICTLSLHLSSRMENLYIHEGLDSSPNWRDDIEDAEWLDLLLPFTAVKDLYLSKQFTPRIARALQELTGGRTTEMFPTLENLFWQQSRPSEPVHEGIVQFISARQLTDRPIALSVWERDAAQERYSGL